MARRFLKKKLGRFVDHMDKEIRESATRLYQRAVAKLEVNLPLEATGARRELAVAVASNPDFYVKKALIDRYQCHPFLELKDGLLRKIYEIL